MAKREKRKLAVGCIAAAAVAAALLLFFLPRRADRLIAPEADDWGVSCPRKAVRASGAF